MATASPFQFITTLTTLIDDKAIEENDDSHNYGSGNGFHYEYEYGMYGNFNHYGPYDYYAEGDLIPHFLQNKCKMGDRFSWIYFISHRIRRHRHKCPYVIGIYAPYNSHADDSCTCGACDF